MINRGISSYSAGKENETMLSLKQVFAWYGLFVITLDLIGKWFLFSKWSYSRSNFQFVISFFNAIYSRVFNFDLRWISSWLYDEIVF